MVEYAVLLAGTSLNSFSSLAAALGTWLTHLNWAALSYALLGLVALRIAFWAFRSNS
jgi:hypothetical protein